MLSLLVLRCAGSDWENDWGPPAAPAAPPQQQEAAAPYYGGPPPSGEARYYAGGAAAAGGGGEYGGDPASQAAYEAAAEAELRAAPASGLVVRVASCGGGAVVGACAGKAVVGSFRPRWAASGGVACVVAGLCGGRFGDAALAVGATTVGAVRGSRRLGDGRYPVFRQFKAGLGLVPREVFPPGAPNPWRYAKRGPEDPDFGMARTLVAAVALGGFGANFLPLVSVFPSSIVAALAAGCAVFAVTLNDARGDAARCLCARVVASAAVVLAAAGDARLGAKTMSAARLGGLRLNALDRKFGVSKTVAGLVSKAVDQASTAAATGEPRRSDAAAADDRRRRPPPHRPHQGGAYDAPPPPPPPHQRPPGAYGPPADRGGGDWGLPQDDYYRR